MIFLAETKKIAREKKQNLTRAEPDELEELHTDCMIQLFLIYFSKPLKVDKVPFPIPILLEIKLKFLPLPYFATKKY